MTVSQRSFTFRVDNQSFKLAGQRISRVANFFPGTADDPERNYYFLVVVTGMTVKTSDPQYGGLIFKTCFKLGVQVESRDTFTLVDPS